MSFWAVAQTEPMNEAKAVEQLKLKSFVAYCPVVNRVRSMKGVKQKYRSPLFPRYIFVEIVREWYAILTTRFVAGLLTTNMSVVNERFEPTEISDEVIPAQVSLGFVDKLRARELNGVIALPEPLPYEIGERVYVKHGTMSGLWGLYDGLGIQQCHRVLFDMLGRQTPVNININNLASSFG